MRCESCGVDCSSDHFRKSEMICDECYEKTAVISKEKASTKNNEKKEMDTGVKGTVKWFSKEKGYGFITIENNKDAYFSVKDVVGAKLPNNGDTVSLEIKEGKKGLYAINIVIIETASNQRDDRIVCPHCSKRIIPRVIVGPPAIRGAYGYTPEPKKSICPFCGGQIQSFSSNNCFIATAVYGKQSRELVSLRQFRDVKLIKTKAGRSFVGVYYRVSPAIAAFIIKNSTLKSVVKWILDKFLVIINRHSKVS
jgi:cold shock CspA family protein